MRDDRLISRDQAEPGERSAGPEQLEEPGEMATGPLLSPAESLSLLYQQRDRAAALLQQRPVSAAVCHAWCALTERYLAEAFGNVRRGGWAPLRERPGQERADVGAAGAPGPSGEEGSADSWAKYLAHQVVLLSGFIQLLETDVALAWQAGAKPIAMPHTTPAPSETASVVVPDSNSISGTRRHIPEHGPADSGETRRRIFVVHGRNRQLRDAPCTFLRALTLQPIEWAQAIAATGKAAPYISEVLDAGFGLAHACVVLLTPDDEARLRQELRHPTDPLYEGQLTGQARPNVLYEAGLARGRFPDRTVLVEVGSLRPFTDVAGIHTIRLSNDSARRQELAQRLALAGCTIDLTGTDWHTAGDFSPADQPNDVAHRTNTDSMATGNALNAPIGQAPPPGKEAVHGRLQDQTGSNSDAVGSTAGNADVRDQRDQRDQQENEFLLATANEVGTGDEEGAADNRIPGAGGVPARATTDALVVVWMELCDLTHRYGAEWAAERDSGPEATGGGTAILRRLEQDLTHIRDRMRTLEPRVGWKLEEILRRCR
ncbi:MAG TPA: nucleotide-binding protein, partial [Chloroflexota bacterium]|nr:nucleotide-binding protein [Chloroflexota bacterium]